MKQIIQTLKFMERVELKWNEVPVFVECINYLNALAKQLEKDKMQKEEQNKS